MNAGLNTIPALTVWFCGLVCVAAAPAAQTNPSDWKLLFNGKDLSGWETFLQGASSDQPSYGLNKDPEKVFGIVMVDGGSAIHISGKYWGGILTTGEFQNYHLRLEFKWGKQTWPPRLNQTPDSGLLYHCIGPPASATNCPWPRSIESGAGVWQFTSPKRRTQRPPNGPNRICPV